MPIDPNQPTEGFATTQSVRDNFQAIIDELLLKLGQTVDGDVTITGTFNTNSIEDLENFGKLFKLTIAAAEWGSGAFPFTHFLGDGTQSMIMSGGSTGSLGGNIGLFGEAHPTVPNRVVMRSNADTWLLWDEGAGVLTLSSGIGAKTTAMQIDVDQNIIMPAMPTAVAGLPSGTLWNNGGVVNIAP